MTSIFNFRVKLFLIFFALATFLLATTSIAFSPSSLHSEPEPADFIQLLNSVPSDRLHAVLHDYEPARYKHGVFREDRTAMEAVHRDDAAKATKLVRIAKRQVTGSGGANGNGTLTTSTTSTTPATISSTTTVEVLPSSSPTTVVTSTFLSTIPSSTSSSTSTAYSTTVMTTITTEVLKTSTFPNGARSTVTEVTVIGVPLPNTAQPTKSSNTQTGSPSLQTNGAVARSPGFGTGLGILVGGAVAGFWFL